MFQVSWGAHPHNYTEIHLGRSVPFSKEQEANSLAYSSVELVTRQNSFTRFKDQENEMKNVP